MLSGEILWTLWRGFCYCWKSTLILAEKNTSDCVEDFFPGWQYSTWWRWVRTEIGLGRVSSATPEEKSKTKSICRGASVGFDSIEGTCDHLWVEKNGGASLKRCKIEKEVGWRFTTCAGGFAHGFCRA
ncbi:unnamed protein product [Linum trigynum]|uniref:Uncharacterized protein n=1 Tax=Linum trigynum TaxID=586398 RepID=A0AAV2DZS8_9ROSI